MKLSSCFDLLSLQETKQKEYLLESEKYRTFAVRNGKRRSMAIDDYRLTDLEEPTEKMLAQVMKEAAEDAREANARATKLFFEEIKQAAASIR